jgi:hypothetical protein
MHCQLPNVQVELAAENGAAVPSSELSDGPYGLRVRFAITPRTSELILDSSQIFYLGENQEPLAPCLSSGWVKKGWTSKDRSLRRGKPSAVAITGPCYFYLDYAVDPNPRVTFTIRVLGLSKDGQDLAVPDIHFKPEFVPHTIVRWPPNGKL